MSSDTWTTYPAQPHTLPFRTILGEYRVRRPADLASVVLDGILRSELTSERHPHAALADTLKCLRSLEDVAQAIAQVLLEIRTLRLEASPLYWRSTF